MSSTNKTTNLELSQFLGSDSPKWLTDYNADMEKIDAGYQTVKAQADATDLVVGGHTSSISTLQDTVTSQGTAITGLRTDVTANSGSINTINSLIGNGEPTTTDKTIIGAINELDGRINSGYIFKGSETFASVTGDGVKTLNDLLAELYNTILTKCATLGSDIVIPRNLALADKGSYKCDNLGYVLSTNTQSYEEKFSYINVWTSGATIGTCILRASNRIAAIANLHESNPYYNLLTDVITDGYNINFYVDRYTSLG